MAAQRYSYRGSDPSLWTRAEIESSVSAAAPSEWTTFIGGSNEYRIARMATDAAGNVVVAGSRVFRVRSSPDTYDAQDVFVTKLDPAGKVLFTATLSGKGSDQCQALALDSSGSIYLGGGTSSANFPLRNPYQRSPKSGFGAANGFITKLSADGSQLIYSTYFPGVVSGIAVDATGSTYVTGNTADPEFPVTAGLPNPRLGGMLARVSGAFVTKLSPAGDRVVYSGVFAGNSVACGAGSSCFLSSRNTSGIAIGLDAAGNAYVAGNTNTTDLPVTAGVLKPRGIGAFVAKVNAAGTAISYLTYIGEKNYVISPFANPANTARDLIVDATGNAYVAGSTSDPDFPATRGAYQTAYSLGTPTQPYPAPAADAFVAKLNPPGSAMVFATFLGGTDAETADALAIDSDGSVVVTGSTASSSFPSANGGTGGNYVVRLSANGSSLTYSIRRPDGAAAHGITLGRDKQIFTGGADGLVSSIMPGAPTSARVFGVANAAAGSLGGRVAPGELVSLYGAFGAGAKVYFDGQSMPVLYAGLTQINTVTPFEISGKEFTTVKVETGAGATSDLALGVTDARPEIFRNAGSNFAAAVNQDGSLNSEQNPAAVGSAVAIWATGIGAVSPLPADGEIPTAAQDYHCCQVTTDMGAAEVLYAGASPGLIAGVVQINFRVPDTGVYPPKQMGVMIRSGTWDSSYAAIWVKP